MPRCVSKPATAPGWNGCCVAARGRPSLWTRLQQVNPEQLVYRLSKPRPDGGTALHPTPLELIARLPQGTRPQLPLSRAGARAGTRGQPILAAAARQRRRSSAAPRVARIAWALLLARNLALYLLLPYDLRAIAKTICCHQDIAADSCFALGMLAHVELARAEPWRYRHLFWECGMLGHALYLEAEATRASLRCRPAPFSAEPRPRASGIFAKPARNYRLEVRRELRHIALVHRLHTTAFEEFPS